MRRFRVVMENIKVRFTSSAYVVLLTVERYLGTT